jgi:hypothetical protein
MNDSRTPTSTGETASVQGPRSAAIWLVATVRQGGLVPFFSSVILLIAAAPKTVRLFSAPVLALLHGSLWLEATAIEYELLLAAWALSRIRLAWWKGAALATFAAFGCYTAYLGISGSASCGCFGEARVNPWLTFALDAALFVSLWTWRPATKRTALAPRTSNVRLRRVLGLSTAVALSAIFGTILLVAIATVRRAYVAADEEAFGNSGFVLLEPDRWVGGRFPLVTYINTADRDRLLRGSWIVVFYHAECSRCQRILSRYESLGQDLRLSGDDFSIALIRVSSNGETEPLVQTACYRGALSENIEWLIKTPYEVRVTDGVVTSATSDPDSSFMGSGRAEQFSPRHSGRE